jgi:hypothetical protein
MSDINERGMEPLPKYVMAHVYERTYGGKTDIFGISVVLEWRKGIYLEYRWGRGNNESLARSIEIEIPDNFHLLAKQEQGRVIALKLLGANPNALKDMDGDQEADGDFIFRNDAGLQPFEDRPRSYGSMVNERCTRNYEVEYLDEVDIECGGMDSIDIF